MSFPSLCEFATELFSLEVKEIIRASKSMDETRIIRPQYIRVITEEIGQDIANDLSSIYCVSEFPGLENQSVIIQNERLFHEYAVALGAAYAIKRGVDVVFFERDETYCWV